MIINNKLLVADINKVRTKAGEYISVIINNKLRIVGYYRYYNSNETTLFLPVFFASKRA